MDTLAWMAVFWGLLGGLSLVEYLRAPTAGTTDRNRRWSINVGFGVLNGLVAASLPVSLVAIALWCEAKGYGLLPAAGAPAWLATIATVLVVSLGQYASHRLAHAWPALWAVHRTHHSDLHLDATSALRFHPIELLAALVLTAPLIALLGPPPWILAGFLMVEAMFGLATHSSLSLPPVAERALNRVVITPALHHLHHSDHLPETDSNFGATLVIWDWLFGTYRRASDRPAAEFRLGLDTVDHAQARSFDWLLTGVLRGVRRSPDMTTPRDRNR